MLVHAVNRICHGYKLEVYLLNMLG